MHIKYCLITALLLFSTVGSAQTSPLQKGGTIYIVRHAEKENGDDPLLTKEGYARAGDLLKELRHKKIHRIYVTEFKRTQHTADSLRLQAAIDTVQVPADTACTHLFNAISTHNDWDNHILIITHSNIMQKIIYKLGIVDFPQKNIPAHEFDNLYQVKIKNRKPVLVHKKYGKPSQPSASMH